MVHNCFSLNCCRTWSTCTITFQNISPTSKVLNFQGRFKTLEGSLVDYLLQTDHEVARFLVSIKEFVFLILQLLS